MSTVIERLAAGEYKNTLPYDIEVAPVDEETMTVRQAREHEAAEKERKREQRRLYAAEENRLVAKFRADLEAENGLTGHPKADALWSLAWQHGHSAGFSEIANHYGEFAELLKP